MEVTMLATAPKTARDIMKSDVITVRDNWDIREALRLFEEKHISGAPVVDIRGDLVGVLSVTDIARAHSVRETKERAESEFYRTTLPDEFPRGFHIERYDTIPVREVMTPVVIDVPEETPIPRLASMMVDLHIHRLIITRSGKLAGIVSSLDMLGLLRKTNGSQTS
jgi:CBS domain-containing protein